VAPLAKARSSPGQPSAKPEQSRLQPQAGCSSPPQAGMSPISVLHAPCTYGLAQPVLIRCLRWRPRPCPRLPEPGSRRATPPPARSGATADMIPAICAK